MKPRAECIHASGGGTAIAPVVVIGVGNVLMGDDGIGPRVAEMLGNTPLPSGVEVIDGGLGGLSLLEWLEGRRRAIIVDAARMGTPPGTIRRFDLDELHSGTWRRTLSGHQEHVLTVLEFGRHIMDLPPVTVYGIEPCRVMPGDRLSPIGEKSLHEAVRLVLAELSDLQGDEHGESKDPFGGR